MAIAEATEGEAYRIIMLRQDGTEVLVVLDNGRFLLPRVTIPHGRRVAESVTAALRTSWGREAVCLFSHSVAAADEPGGEIRFQFCEQWREIGSPSLFSTWVPMRELSASLLLDANDAAMVGELVAARSFERAKGSLGPFARRGWFPELRAWIAAAIQPRGLHLGEDFQQVNASPCFSLIRFATDGPAVWFKAVGDPNRRELPVTSTLALHFPTFLPSLLAVHSGCNGWVAEEVQGRCLADTLDVGDWEAGVAALARLQIATIGHEPDLLAAGAHDLGAATLSGLVGQFFQQMMPLMEAQEKVPPSILKREPLLRLGERLAAAIGALAQLGVPDTLGHLDLNPQNIIVTSSRCTFLDWAEAGFGNPFLSFQYMLEHFRRAQGRDRVAEAKLTAAYCEPWQPKLTDEVITKSLSFSPLVAVFAYAVTLAAAKPAKLGDGSAAAYLRSLTRRMDREANCLCERGCPCPN